METGRPHDLQQGLNASMNRLEILTSTATPPPVPADYFAQILETLREGVAVHDRSLRYVVWNAALEELTGLSRAEVLGKLPGEVFPRLYDYGLDACLARALAGETVQLPEQLYYLQPINRELWVALRFSPWRDCRGEIIGVITTIDDTTARRQAELAQFRQAEKYQAILADNQEGYYECDLAGNILFCNDALCRMYGYTPAEVIGENYRSFAGRPAIAAQAYLTFKEVYRTGVPQLSQEWEDVNRYGAPVFVEVSVSLMKDERGQAIGFRGIVRDVAARKKLEAERDRITESLRTSEARFRAMIEKSAEGIALMTAEGHLTYTSPAFTRLLGYTAQETLGQSVISRIHSEDAPRLRSQLGALLSQPNATLQAEYRAQHQDGSWRFLEANITNLLHESNVGAIVVNFRDITERQRSEEQLRLLGAAVKQAGESILITTANLDLPGPEIVFVNPAFTQITGYTLEEVLGKTPRLLQGPRTDRATLDRLRAQLARGERFVGEAINYRKDGTEYYLEWVTTPVFNQTGEITHYIAVQRDITARKQAEQALLKSERRFRAVFDNAQDAILIFDDEMRILEVNAAACELYGYSRVELLAGRLWDFTTFNSMAAARATFQELLRDGQQQRAMPVLRADGTRREIEYNATANFLPGRHLTICRDVTARKHAETIVRGQVKVLRLIAAGVPLARTLEVIARLVEKLSRGVRCSILLLDEDGQHLRHGAAPRLPEEFNRFVDGLAIGPNVGSCGMAAFKGKPVIVTDIAHDPLWINGREQARKYGLRACWSTPILTTTGRVLGTFALYYREVHAPHAAELKLVESLTPLAAIAIERERSEQALRQSEERYRELFEQAPIGIYRTTPDGRVLMANPTMLRMLGCDSFAELAQRDFEQEGWGLHHSRQQFRELIEAQGEVKGLEVVWQRRTGELINVRQNAILKRDEHGQVLYYEGTVEDITERKQAEEALRASETRFFTAFNSSPCPMTMLTFPEGRFVSVNEIWQRDYGFSLEEVIGRSSADLNYWVKLEQRAELYERLQAHGSVRNLEVLLRTKGGAIRTTVVSAEIIEVDGMKYVLSSSNDITERKRAEDALRESEARFRTLAETASDAIITIDEASRITFVNPATEKVFGYPLREMLGANLTLLMPTQPGRLHQAGFARYLQTGQRSIKWESLELMGRHRDGQEIPLEISFGEFAHQGRRYFTGIARDITERKRAEEALRESEARFRLLFERNLAGVYRATTSGQLLEANDALARIFGFESRAEILHLDTRRLYADRRTRAQIIKTLRRDGRLNNFELLLRRRDGATVWTLSNITLLPGTDGQPEILEGVMLDITELKQAEMALAQSREELRALSARLEAVREEERIRIAREIHDNLGQLLTGLKLDLSWLDKRIQEATDETLRKRTAPKMVEVAALLEETIQAVRDIATELRPGILDTLGLRAALEWQAREFEKRTGVKCRMQLGQVPPRLAPERTTMLFRIFQEILTNVARHARARHVQVRLTEAPGELRLLVHDDGVGISAAQRDHPKSLGLIGMRERALLFGGSLIIEGKPGRGTTVEVRVPL